VAFYASVNVWHGITTHQASGEQGVTMDQASLRSGHQLEPDVTLNHRVFYTNAAFDAIFVQSSKFVASEQTRHRSAIRFYFLSLKRYIAS
jgi:hypothetical protein